MRATDNIRLALAGVASNPVRSILTALGVIIGVAAVITVVSVGTGAKLVTAQEIQRLGSNLLTITSGYRSARAGLTEDVIPVIESCSLITEVAPQVTSSGTASYGSQSLNTTIMGTSANYPEVRNLKIARGTFLADSDIEELTWSCVLGADLAAELFQGEDPLGKKVRLDRVKFTVVGVAEPMGDSALVSMDNMMYVPYTTLQKRVTGSKYIGSISAKVVGEEHMDAARDQVYAALLAELQDENAFRVTSQADLLEIVSNVTGTLTLLLSSIAAVSLLVGGIGIMNIMLVSVTERIREIGIRKAIGARDREILGQFMLEAAALSLTGGALGVLFGYLGSRAINTSFGWPTAIDMRSVVIGLTVSLGIGLFFGSYPAWKAARLDPIEGLRHE